MPLIRISVCDGVSHFTPCGIWCTTGCEKPSDRFNLSPCACALYPTPTKVSFFSKPLVTPLTMLLTKARSVPDMALASRLSSAAWKVSVPSWLLTFTSEDKRCDKAPNGPFTVICSAEIVASAPFGSAIGILPTRDILHSLGHVANDFAAHAGGARLAVRHDALRSRYNRHSQAVHNIRNIVLALVNAQARTGDTLQALNHRATGIVFQTDLQFGFAAGFGHGEIFDIALILEHMCNRDLHFG